MARKHASAPEPAPRLGELLRLPPGPVDLEGVDPRATPGLTGGKAAAAAQRDALAQRLSDLQEQLYAEGRTGGGRSLLLVLQGLDTAGKGGTVRHVLGQVDPAGVQIAAFAAPTEEERRHDFLWRVRPRLPGPGMLGVFDRSHYEDVVTARVLRLVDHHTWKRRYRSIERFEDELSQAGTRIVKCYLHISRAESRKRLLARLDDPTKQWKFDPGDLDTRARWGAYLHAYGQALEHCSWPAAPWYVVPADRKWYRNWAITTLLIEQLEELALRWPAPDYDVAQQRERLLAMG